MITKKALFLALVTVSKPVTISQKGNKKAKKGVFTEKMCKFYIKIRKFESKPLYSA